jgi:hypothetical protein
MPQATRSAKRRSSKKSAPRSAAQKRAADTPAENKNPPSKDSADDVLAAAQVADVPSTLTTGGVQINDLTKRSDSDIILGHFATIVGGDHTFTYPDPDVTRTDPETGEQKTEKAPERKINLIGQRVVLESVVSTGKDGYPELVQVRLSRPSSALVQVPYKDLAPATAL